MWGSETNFFWHILANLGDFLKHLAQKGVGVRPPLDQRLRSEAEHATSRSLMLPILLNLHE